MSKNLILTIFSLFILICLTYCSDDVKESVNDEYAAEIEKFHEERIEGLKENDGWLNLVGLYWLKDGRNTFGGNDENDIVFPSDSLPARIGTFTLNDTVVTVEIEKGVPVKSDGKIISDLILKPDVSGEPTILELNSLRWFLIKRGERYGIRVRDLNAPLVEEFEGIERFPLSEKWRVKADTIPYDPAKEIIIPTIIGTSEKVITPVSLEFMLDGIKYRLDPIPAGDGYFIIFGDQTNGLETYGGGRFLMTETDSSTGKIILDFNKAVNPPCAFTKFATCPLPPKQNYLKLDITAGERKYGDH